MNGDGKWDVSGNGLKITRLWKVTRCPTHATIRGNNGSNCVNNLTSQSMLMNGTRFVRCLPNEWINGEMSEWQPNGGNTRTRTRICSPSPSQICSRRLLLMSHSRSYNCCWVPQFALGIALCLGMGLTKRFLHATITGGVPPHFHSFLDLQIKCGLH